MERQILLLATHDHLASPCLSRHLGLTVQQQVNACRTASTQTNTLWITAIPTGADECPSPPLWESTNQNWPVCPSKGSWLQIATIVHAMMDTMQPIGCRNLDLIWMHVGSLPDINGPALALYGAIKRATSQLKANVGLVHVFDSDEPHIWYSWSEATDSCYLHMEPSHFDPMTCCPSCYPLSNGNSAINQSTNQHPSNFHLPNHSQANEHGCTCTGILLTIPANNILDKFWCHTHLIWSSLIWRGTMYIGDKSDPPMVVHRMSIAQSVYNSTNLNKNSENLVDNPEFQLDNSVASIENSPKRDGNITTSEATIGRSGSTSIGLVDGSCLYVYHICDIPSMSLVAPLLTGYAGILRWGSSIGPAHTFLDDWAKKGENIILLAREHYVIDRDDDSSQRCTLNDWLQDTTANDSEAQESTQQPGPPSGNIYMLTARNGKVFVHCVNSDYLIDPAEHLALLWHTYMSPFKLSNPTASLTSTYEPYELEVLQQLSCKWDNKNLESPRAGANHILPLGPSHPPVIPRGLLNPTLTKTNHRSKVSSVHQPKSSMLSPRLQSHSLKPSDRHAHPAIVREKHSHLPKQLRVPSGDSTNKHTFNKSHSNKPSFYVIKDHPGQLDKSLIRPRKPRETIAKPLVQIRINDDTNSSNDSCLKVPSHKRPIGEEARTAKHVKTNSRQLKTAKDKNNYYIKQNVRERLGKRWNAADGQRLSEDPLFCDAFNRIVAMVRLVMNEWESKLYSKSEIAANVIKVISLSGIPDRSR